jgi:deoxyribonucleoside regulator
VTIAETEESSELLAVRVAELYYEANKTQDEVGSILGITRWKVGRLLTLARDRGIVRIQIVHPRARQAGLELALRERFGLSDVVVVSRGATEAETAGRVALAAADHLTNLHLDGARLGVSWGATMSAVAGALSDGWADGVAVVQVNGGVSLTSTVDTAAATAVSIAQKGRGKALLLPTPAVLEREETRAVIEADRTIAAVLSEAARASVYLYSAGPATERSALVDSGYLSAADISGLVARGAVGDVVGRYIDADGRIVDPALDARTVGIGLDDLRASANAIFVVSGAAKNSVAHAVVANGLCSTLITDDVVARSLIESSAESREAKEQQ